MKKFATVLFLVISFVSIAQKREIDSLVVVLNAAKEDTFKVNTLNVLSDKLWQRGDYKQAMDYVVQGKTLAEKINFKKGKATAFIHSALIYWKQGEYPKALEQIFIALKINEEIKYRKGIARSYNCIGLIYFNQQNYQGALENYFKSLQIRKEINDMQGVAGSLNNIGEVYKEQKKFDKALEHYFMALRINEETGNINWASININNIGTIYYAKGEMASSGNGEKNAYYNKALDQYFKALEIREKIGDKQGVALSYISIGLVYTRLSKNAEAKKYMQDALAFSKKIGYKEAIKASYYGLSVLDSTVGSWHAAYQNHKQFVAYRDSLLNEENMRKSISAEMSFFFEKKEQDLKQEQERKDALAKEEKQRKNIIIGSVSVGLVFVLVLALVIFRSLRQNQKQNKIITAQKELVEKQKHIVDEKQKEITDSINYAERIQRSFLATDQLLSENLKDYFVFFQPKDVVSGDFYWASKLQSGEFVLVTADSTGHGVPGAIMSILNITCLEKAVEEKQLTQPAEILNYTRTKIIERLKKDGSAEGGKDGMDCSLLRFDFRVHKLCYAAANNPVWIVKNETEKKLIELAPDKMPVGRHDRDANSFTQHIVDLNDGDMVYTITDGMPDQFGGPKGKKFMYKQLKELLVSIASLPVVEQKEKLQDAFVLWKGNLEQVDDVCVIGVRV
ncbi:MAG: tetratricopeptide repeat protein [Bacteroidetes bacterium]|nr:tetratricopeptide repeat protein [Bacteroidota bacterium]